MKVLRVGDDLGAIRKGRIYDATLFLIAGKELESLDGFFNMNNNWVIPFNSASESALISEWLNSHDIKHVVYNKCITNNALGVGYMFKVEFEVVGLSL